MTFNKKKSGICEASGSSFHRALKNPLQRSVPQFKREYCTNCFLCWLYCPDDAIIIENSEIRGISGDFCKECGICVNVCPVEGADRPLTYASSDHQE